MPTPDYSMPAIYGLINQERARHGRHVLAVDGELAEQCQRQVSRMYTTHRLHYSDELNADEELIIAGAPNWSAALDSWMSMQETREIVLDPHLTRFGASTAGNYRCVQFSRE